MAGPRLVRSPERLTRLNQIDGVLPDDQSLVQEFSGQIVFFLALCNFCPSALLRMSSFQQLAGTRRGRNQVVRALSRLDAGRASTVVTHAMSSAGRAIAAGEMLSLASNFPLFSAVF
jgi:hypothetical protein